jgi:MGT family glycosyltransferase
VTGRTGTFLFVTWPGGGNIHPLVTLGLRLLERGHTVRALAAAELAPRFEAEGIAFRAHRTGAEWTGGHPIRWPDATEEQRMAYLRGLADDVLAETARECTDVAVVDYMQPDALCAAERSGAPCVAFVHTLYTGVALSERSPMSMTADVGRINTLRDGLGLDRLSRITDLLSRASRTLIATVPEFDGADAPLAPNLRYVGPLVEPAGPDANWSPPTRPPSPQGDRPLVLVAMGTTPMDEAPVIQRVLDALANLPVIAYVTLGAHIDPSALRVPANATISGYVRHAAVMPHARLFVTHCGLSGIGAALTFGVPMLCLPLGREQPANAARVEAVGAGRALSPDASVEELWSTLQALLAGDATRAAARAMASTIAAYGNGERAAEELEQLL